jgi:hypothetical protein
MLQQQTHPTEVMVVGPNVVAEWRSMRIPTPNTGSWFICCQFASIPKAHTRHVSCASSAIALATAIASTPHPPPWVAVSFSDVVQAAITQFNLWYHPGRSCAACSPPAVHVSPYISKPLRASLYLKSPWLLHRSSAHLSSSRQVTTT